MKVIGLTGGIASGKSLVAGMLGELGAHIIDADAVAREVVAPGSAVLRAIQAAFGPSVLLADGTLDRKALAERVFREPAARRTLNAIMHPEIRRRIEDAIARVRATRPDAIVVVDIPLLLDTAAPDAYALDGIVVVSIPEEEQIARLMVRDGLDEAAARGRVASQRPLRDKVGEADWVIDNSGTRAHTRRQVEELWRRWQARPRTP